MCFVLGSHADHAKLDELTCVILAPKKVLVHPAVRPSRRSQYYQRSHADYNSPSNETGCTHAVAGRIVRVYFVALYFGCRLCHLSDGCFYWPS